MTREDASIAADDILFDETKAFPTADELRWPGVSAGLFVSNVGGEGALAPGYLDTDMINRYPAGQTAAPIAKTPMGRFAEPTEVADAALVLASDSSSDITGAVLDINGGRFISFY